MVITVDLAPVADLLAYLLIGFGVGYMVTLGVTGGPTSLDQKKHDLVVKKEWIKMLAEQSQQRAKKAKWEQSLKNIRG